MRKPILALALALPLLAPAAAEARMVRITTTLNAYGGDGAYLAIYVTDRLASCSRRSTSLAGKPSTTSISPAGSDKRVAGSTAPQVQASDPGAA